MMDALDSILEAPSMGLMGIAAISLSMAGIRIINVMLVNVTESTAEIDLIKSVELPMARSWTCSFSKPRGLPRPTAGWTPDHRVGQ